MSCYSYSPRLVCIDSSRGLASLDYGKDLRAARITRGANIASELLEIAPHVTRKLSLLYLVGYV